jgi:hypothetical protein
MNIEHLSDKEMEDGIEILQAELLRRYEELKCCGNCYNDGDFCDFERCSPQKYCRRWQSDGLTREEREGK